MASNEEQAKQVARVLAVFSPLVSDGGCIEWGSLCKVLKLVDPDGLGREQALNRLWEQVLPERTRARPHELVNLEHFLGALFKSPSSIGSEQAKSVQSVEDGCAVRVRKAGGDLQLSLRRSELEHATVRTLHEQCLKTLEGKLTCELVALGRTLRRGELLTELVGDREVLEVLMVIKELPELDPDVPPVQQLGTLLHMISTDSPDIQLTGVRHIRKLLSMKRNPPVREVVEAGFMPHLVKLSRDGEEYELQFEALWALTNVASGPTEDTQLVVNSGAVPVFVALLSSPNESVREQSAWGLGNVSGDSVALRNLVIAAGALPPLLAILNQSTKCSMLRTCAWCLSNCLRRMSLGRLPPPAAKAIEVVLPTLSHLLYNTDPEVFTDVCWSLQFLRDTEQKRHMIRDGALGRLAELLPLEQQYPTVVVSTAMRAFGSLVTGTGDDELGGAMPSLDCFGQLLTHPCKDLRKESLRVLAKVTAGSSHWIQKVIDAGLLHLIVNRVTSARCEERKDAAWAVSNACSGGTREQVDHWVNGGCIPRLMGCLSEKSDEGMLAFALKGLAAILEKSPEDGRESLYLAAMKESTRHFKTLVDMVWHSAEHPNLEAVLQRIAPYIQGDEGS